jgi:hypothetical protein
MEAYERRMTAMRTGEFVPPPDDAYDPEADMRALAAGRKKKEKESERESYLSREQLMELRKVQNERVEVSVVRDPGELKALKYVIGRENEVAWYGREAELWRSYGRCR